MIKIISGIPVEINKKNVKTMRLYVKPPNGDIMVSAPLTMSNDVIEKFVWTKTDWIKEQIKKFSNQYQSDRKYVTGETLNVWGKKYTLQVKSGKKNSIVLSDDTAIFTTRQKSTADQRKIFARKWYRKLLTAEITKLLPKWETKTKLKVSSWNIKYMTSRWGSCKPKQRKICFNLQLAAKPPECLEYIILHELIHFIEKGHNKYFYSMVESYMPAWKSVRGLLR